MIQAIINKLWSCFVLCFFILVTAACSERSHSPKSNIVVVNYSHFNQHLADSVIALLHTGDVVLRAGTGPFSYMLANINQKDKSYSHCGIVVIEAGYPFVYHCIGGEDNAEERLRRDSVSFFFSPARNMGIATVRYDMDAAALHRFTTIVHDYYKLRPVFDPKFDLTTDNELYCSEFVYKAVTKAVNDTGYLPKSYGYNRAYIGIDDLYMNPHASIIYNINYR